jgi:hypothetical protein
VYEVCGLELRLDGQADGSVVVALGKRGGTWRRRLLDTVVVSVVGQAKVGWIPPSSPLRDLEKYGGPRVTLAQR